LTLFSWWRRLVEWLKKRLKPPEEPEPPMPRTGVAVCSRPNYEEVTNAGGKALKHAVDAWVSRGYAVTDLFGADATKANILAALTGQDPILFFGCVTEDSIVPLPNGNIVQVKDLVSPTSIFSAHVEGSLKEEGSKKKARLDVDTCTHLIFKGHREVWRLKTPFMQIEATPDHEFFVRSSDPKDGGQASWKHLGQIKVRDKVLAVTKLPFMPTVNPPLSESQTQCLGFYVGDGTMYEEEDHGVWQVRLTDLQAKEEYSELFAEEFHVNPLDKGERGFLVCNKKLVKLIKGLGLGVKSPLRDIPEIICRSPLPHQITFISGILDSDGYVNLDDGSIRFYSSSKLLIAKQQMLLLRLGVLSSIYSKNKVGEPVTIKGKITGYTKHPAWTLVISGVDAFKLAKMLKPLSENKKEALRKLIDRYAGLSRKPQPRGLVKVNEYLAFLRVKEIEKVGVKPVYDLVVGNNHDFVVNGIVAHNCGHGNEDVFTAQGGERVFWTCDCSALRGRIVYALSCITAARLGPDAVNNKGARTYIGYADTFGWVQADMNADPLVDTYAKGFYDAVLGLLGKLTDGASTGDAYKASMDIWNYWVNFWSGSTDPNAAAVLQWLLHDRDCQKLLGDGSVTVAMAAPVTPGLWWLLQVLGAAMPMVIPAIVIGGAEADKLRLWG